MNKKIILPAFILMVLAQLYVPGRMIFYKESVLTSGTEYKFKTAPVDPNDPFRGKYIVLSFDENSINVEDATDWLEGDLVYVELITDTAGYAKILSVSKTEPMDHEAYVKATINYTIPDTMSMVFVRYPFDRFYMEESKASDAGRVYMESASDSNQVTYALVLVKNGDAVVKDVLINEVSIVDIVKQKQSMQK